MRLLCESPVQEWDYTVLMAADPLTRLLELIDEVRLDNLGVLLAIWLVRLLLSPMTRHLD